MTRTRSGGWRKASEDTSEVVSLLRSAVADDPPVAVGDGRVIRQGFSKELDEIRSATHSAQQYIAKLESRERERTGIKSLKVGYNKVFGYYIEISNSNLKMVPGRLRSTPDARRRRAVHHARDEGVRIAHSHGPGSPVRA